MRRFFLPAKISSKNTATIEGSEVHHIRNVLRLKRGDHIRVFDGTGLEYIAAISSITSQTVKLRLEKKIGSGEKDPLRIFIGQALLKSQKMNFIIQKITELGASGLYPFTCERSVPNLDIGKTLQKKKKWNKIAIEALKQCNRPTLPIIYDIQPWSSLLADCQKNDLKIILWEKATDNNLKEVLARSPAPKTVCLLIGPEGGFSAAEVDKAVEAGFIPVSLGRNILRAETATLVVLGIIQYELGFI